ncbi:cytochrome c family protein [Mucilaginibacter sp. L3T2-6]|uniref:c-type cytochrome n=1 Tax=Mucilaginibacter sp. L3T2-6 TaxID=3062491 RepID=UPI0026768DBA|nr:cytochrome c [Mucilaginibacter sp. L3T2-6]MDO3643632.1 cytochrome c [Mucilaginibacter sp. L3T2-6]MDV6216120.1 cytochrome c [Mucilaginibacter sp. L3T2-6]
MKTTKLKQLISVITISLVAFLSACGGSGSESSSSDTSSTAAASAVSADPAAKSDSKGVGKFTSVQLGAIDAGMAEKGKAVFTAKCSACHKVTTDRVVGPGLKGVTERRTPEWIMNQITNPVEMEQKDPVGKALLAQYLTQMTFQNVTDDETRQILEYFRQNDKK